MKRVIEKILIVRTDRLGDLILTLPMAAAVKSARPTTRVSVLVRSYTEPIADRSPDVDEVIPLSDGLSFWGLVRLLRKNGADAVFFPNPSLSVALAAWIARIPIRIGTAYRWYSFLYTNRIRQHRKTAEMNEAEFNLSMLREIGIEAPRHTLPRLELGPSEIAATRSWLMLNLGEEPRFAVLHIGSSGSSQDWPADRFALLGKWLAQRLACTIVLTGLPSESERLLTVAGQIEEAGFRATLFVGKPLPELAVLLSRAVVVVSNSTGPGHLAAALGTPTVGLFPLPKAISKERWGFRGRQVTNLSPAPIKDCPACLHCTCMERLEIQDVEDVVAQLLSRHSTST